MGDIECAVGSRVLGRGGRIAGNRRQNAGPPEVELRATGGRMPDQREQKGCHVKQNGGQPGAEWRAIGSKIAGNREQKVGFGKRKARNFGVCALLLFVLLPGPTCRTRLGAGPDAAGGG